MKIIKLIFILLALVGINANRFKARMIAKAKLKSESKLKNKSNQLFIDSNFNGSINPNGMLQYFSDPTPKPTSSNIINHRNNIPPRSSRVKNEEISKTFKSVSPIEDSTVTPKGIKYSKLFNFVGLSSNSKSKHPGYYGQSRLT